MLKWGTKQTLIFSSKLEENCDHILIENMGLRSTTWAFLKKRPRIYNRRDGRMGDFNLRAEIIF